MVQQHRNEKQTQGDKEKVKQGKERKRGINEGGWEAIMKREQSNRVSVHKNERYISHNHSISKYFDTNNLEDHLYHPDIVWNSNC